MINSGLELGGIPRERISDPVPVSRCCNVREHRTLHSIDGIRQEPGVNYYYFFSDPTYAQRFRRRSRLHWVLCIIQIQLLFSKFLKPT
jgi:hypothetical protein